MTSNISLRRSLRRIPEFRSLHTEDLNAVIDRMVCKEYKAGDLLWRVGNPLDFLGVIQSGEIAIEYSINNSAMRSVWLRAGDHVRPRDLNGVTYRSSVRAQAMTDVRLYVLRIGHLSILPSKWLALNNFHQAPQNNAYSGIWRMLWTVVVAIGILLMIQADARRILSGILYFASNRAEARAEEYQKSLGFLKFAEVLDPEAVFSYNQQGYIWYQQENLQLAKTSFRKAIEIDEHNGPALNNLGVLYFLEGDLQQAILYQQEAVLDDQNRALIRYNLGIALANQNLYAEAIREFKEASYIDSSWPLPYIQQGLIHIKTQDYVHAEEEARAAIRLDETQQLAHLILAIALYNQNNDQDALRSIENALLLSPDEPVALFYEALILRELGRTGSALLLLHLLLDRTEDPQQLSRIAAEIDAIHLDLENRSPGRH